MLSPTTRSATHRPAGASGGRATLESHGSSSSSRPEPAATPSSISGTVPGASAWAGSGE
jgi:hypothetical protein